MQKRRIILGDYDTAEHGWTLTGWKLSPAEQKTKYKEKPNGDGAWDLSTATTDGQPRYQNRGLTITLESSEGTRMTREAAIRHLVNLLDGMQLKIQLPDDDFYHVVGRVHVSRDYNNLAHAAVVVTATCEPWKYANTETVVSVDCTQEKKVVVLYNRGRRAVVPTLKVEGSSVLLEYNTASIALATGTRQWPNLLLTPGGHAVTFSGAGVVTVSYREAVLE